MRVLRTVSERVSGFSGALAALLLIAIMVMTVADVVRRALTDKSIQGVIEVAPLFLLGAVALGFGQAETAGTHVRTSLVTDHLPHRLRSALRSVGYAASIYILLWMAKLSYERAVDAYDNHDTTAGFESIPTWPARALVPIGLALWALALFVRLLQDLRGVRGLTSEEPPSEQSAPEKEAF
jgi:TRAP-type C4-dicarboxylate transport system permease small subunit